MSSPFLLTVLTIILWSTAGAFAKSSTLPGNAALYIITVLSALISFEAGFWRQEKRLFIPTLKEITSKKSYFASLGFGFYWLFLGLSMEKSSNASLPMALSCAWPLFNSLFVGLYFSPKLLKTENSFLTKSSVGLTLGFVGVLVLFLGGNSEESYTTLDSAILAILAGASFGLYSAYSSVIKEREHLSFLILSCISGFIVLLPWAIITYSSIAQLALQNILIAILFGVVVDGFGTFLWTRANSVIAERKLNISSITSLTLILPFLTAFWLYLIFGEQQIFQVSYLFGLLFLLVGILLCNKKA